MSQTDQPLKIAFYMTTEIEHPGGCEKYMIETASELANNPHTVVDVVTMDRRFTERIERMLSVYFMKRMKVKDRLSEDTADVKRRLSKAGYHKMATIKELGEKLREYDIVYSKNEMLEAGIFKLFIGYGNLPPIVFGGHTPLHYPDQKTFGGKLHNALYMGWPYRFFAGGVSKFHALNTQEEKNYRKQFPSKPVEQVYNPFDADKFKLSAKQNTFPSIDSFSEKKINILWAGRLTEQKGVADLSRLIPEVNKLAGASYITWHICGDGLLRPIIDELVSSQPNVVYHGLVPQRFMASIYSRNQILVSTSKWEGYPYGMIEPQVFGLQIFGYTIPGSVDILRSYEGGVAAKDVDEMAVGIAKAVKDKRSPKEIPTSRASKQFAPDVIYTQLTKMLQPSRV